MPIAGLKYRPGLSMKSPTKDVYIYEMSQNCWEENKSPSFYEEIWYSTTGCQITHIISILLLCITSQRHSLTLQY